MRILSQKRKIEMLFLSFVVCIKTKQSNKMNTQLATLSASLATSLASPTDDTTRLHLSIPKIRKLYKFLNDNFFAIKDKMDDGEKELVWHFNISKETFMDEFDYLIEFSATITRIVKRKERTLYTARQINSWNKTRKQLLDFEEKYKKYIIGIISQIPCDLTQTIASYL